MSRTKIRVDHAPVKSEKHDTVHMSIIENGARTKRTCQIQKARLSPYGYWEYQLATLNSSNGLYKKGEWVREKDSRAETSKRAYD